MSDDGGASAAPAHSDVPVHITDQDIANIRDAFGNASNCEVSLPGDRHAQLDGPEVAVPQGAPGVGEVPGDGMRILVNVSDHQRRSGTRGVVGDGGGPKFPRRSAAG
jgi:hypothetical protein